MLSSILHRVTGIGNYLGADESGNQDLVDGQDDLRILIDCKLGQPIKGPAG